MKKRIPILTALLAKRTKAHQPLDVERTNTNASVNH
jgi:hypothetical protein